MIIQAVVDSLNLSIRMEKLDEISCPLALIKAPVSAQECTVIFTLAM